MMSPRKKSHPKHKVETKHISERVEVFMDGEKVAETRDAIQLLESGHDPVFYIPWDDTIDLDFIKCEDYECPFKGHAELLTVNHGENRYDKAAWTYDKPFKEFQKLKNRVAFYPEKVQEIRVTK